MRLDPQTCRQPQDGARVLRNVRLVERDPHGQVSRFRASYHRAAFQADVDQDYDSWAVLDLTETARVPIYSSHLQRTSSIKSGVPPICVTFRPLAPWRTCTPFTRVPIKRPPARAIPAFSGTGCGRTARRPRV